MPFGRRKKSVNMHAQTNENAQISLSVIRVILPHGLRWSQQVSELANKIRSSIGSGVLFILVAVYRFDRFSRGTSEPDGQLRSAGLTEVDIDLLNDQIEQNPWLTIHY